MHLRNLWLVVAFFALVACGSSEEIDSKESEIGEVRQSAPGWEGKSPIRIDEATAKAIQSALCLKPRERGTCDAETEAHLRLYSWMDATNMAGGDAAWHQQSVQLNQDQVTRLRDVGPCPPGGKNILEYKILEESPTTAHEIATKIREKFGIAGDLPFTQLRKEIAAWRTELELGAGPGGFFGDQITPELLDVIVPPLF